MSKMKKIRSFKNQYLGINAHLHSYWQADGDWSEFHTSYIVDVTKAIKLQLLPLGYTAAIEKSLQIRRMDKLDSEPKSDLTIYDPDPVRPFVRTTTGFTGAYDAVLDLPEILDYEEEPAEFRAIAIYEAVSGDVRGEPVAWIELLSPSNKPGGQHATEYRLKRRKLLDSAIVFVEVDYLHESAPTFSRIPSYRVRGRSRLPSPEAHPYRILVIEPRPMISEGKLYLHQFDVNDPIPAVAIPLNADDVLKFDFGTPYHKTVQEALFTYEFVDYSELPENFDRYSERDQTHIVACMVAILEAAHQGIDLETGPFPCQEITLETALAQLEILQHQND